MSSFLNSVKNRVPQTLNVSRAKTNLTMLRSKAVAPIYNTIATIIRNTPTLTRCKAHRGGNNSSLFLSYHDRADALDLKNIDAPAFEYPIWQHVPFEATMFQGRGGFDFSNPVDLDHNNVLTTIKAILPKNDIAMNEPSIV